MNTQDLIFWYTGGFIWAVIAISVAMSILIAAIIGVARIYHASIRWNALWKFIHLTNEEREAFFNAARNTGLTQTEWDKFMKIIVKHKDKLSKMAKGPVKHLECSQWYELTDGTVGQIISIRCATNSDYQMRTTKDELVDIKSDGTLLNNPAIRVLKEYQPNKLEEGVVKNAGVNPIPLVPKPDISPPPQSPKN